MLWYTAVQQCVNGIQCYVTPSETCYNGTLCPIGGDIEDYKINKWFIPFIFSKIYEEER